MNNMFEGFPIWVLPVAAVIYGFMNLFGFEPTLSFNGSIISQIVEAKKQQQLKINTYENLIIQNLESKGFVKVTIIKHHNKQNSGCVVVAHAKNSVISKFLNSATDFTTTSFDYVMANDQMQLSQTHFCSKFLLNV